MQLINTDVSNLVKFTQSIIDFDNSALLYEAKAITQKYATLIVTEDMLIEIGKERAQLNKFVKSLDDARKKVKADYNQPLLEFEAKIKDVSAIFLQTIADIDNQTEVYENQRKEAKRVEVQAIIDDAIKNSTLTEKYASQLVIIDKFLNKSLSLNKIREEVQETITHLLANQENERIALELRTSKIRERELLIENLNHKTGFSFTYSKLNIDSYNDDQVHAFYEEQLANKKEAIPFDAENKKPEIATKPHMASMTITISGAKLENIKAIVDVIKAKGYEIDILKVVE